MDQKQLDNIRARTTLFDPVDYLQCKEDMAAYLEAAQEEGDPKLITSVLKDIARARERLRQPPARPAPQEPPR
jgi:DNA-binding phage protein